MFPHHTPVSRWHDTGPARYVFLPNSWNGSGNRSSSSAFYANLPPEAIGREMNLEPLGVEVLAVCSNKGFPLLYFKRDLWPVQRNSLFRIEDVAAVLDNATTRGHPARLKWPRRKTLQEELLSFSPSALDKMTSQATSVDPDPIPSLLIGHSLLRKWRTATEEDKRRRRNRKSDFQWELRSQIWHVYLLAIKHSKNRKTQIMLGITVTLFLSLAG